MSGMFALALLLFFLWTGEILPNTPQDDKIMISFGVAICIIFDLLTMKTIENLGKQKGGS